VQVGGLRIRVAERGEGKPLLLITGLGGNLDMWEPLERVLGDRRVIAFDPPGAGESSRPRLPLRMRGIARVITELLDELGHDRVDVLGASLGGAIAQELALRQPNRVRRLVLCATSPGFISRPPNPLLALLVLIPGRYYSRTLFELTMPRIAGGRTAREPERLQAQAGPRLARPPELLGFLYQASASIGWTSLPWLHRLRQPTLVISGEKDPIIPPINGRLLARRIPDARLHIVPGGGHLFVLDEPESIVGPLEAFLDAEEGPA
jgi:poly(3-hydroxyalkanoate) depolymerase